MTKISRGYFRKIFAQGGGVYQKYQPLPPIPVAWTLLLLTSQLAPFWALSVHTDY